MAIGDLYFNTHQIVVLTTEPQEEGRLKLGSIFGTSNRRSLGKALKVNWKALFLELTPHPGPKRRFLMMSDKYTGICWMSQVDLDFIMEYGKNGWGLDE